MSEWISVEDGLPEIGKEVLVHLGDFGVATAYLHDELAWFIKFDKEGWDYLITHWQPLPLPPQGD